MATRLQQRRIEPAFVIAWSAWRRAHQAMAQTSHRKRKAQLTWELVRQDAGLSEHRSDLRLVFDIQGLSPLHDLARVQRQLQLTSGRCSHAAAPSSRLQRTWAQATGPFCSAAFQALLHIGPSTWIRRN